MQFFYQARTSQGNVRGGTVEAVSADAAIEALQRSGFIVIDIKEAGQLPVTACSITSFLHLHRGVPKKEVVIFSKQISTLFQAKVPLIETLKTMMEQTANPTFKDVLLNVAKSVDSGSSLSKALAAHKNVFSEFYVSMVRSGEASGKLEEVFNYLADGLEREYYMVKKIKGALTYPAFIVTAFAGVMFVMMIWVVPNLTSVLKETGAEMPFLTRMVIYFTDTFKDYWWAVLLALALAGGALWYFINTKEGKSFWHAAALRLPIFGGMLQKFYLARFADNLSVLIQGGLPIVQSLEITSDVIGNMVYKGILSETIEEVKRGNTISSVLRGKKEIPIMVSQMVFVGEESGRLDATLKSVASFYQKEVSVAIESIVTLIEPLLILLLGVGVAILLVAILIPMYNIAQNF